jgi:alpha-glucosidase (family GH31 glycosyl hydrolase)
MKVRLGSTLTVLMAASLASAQTAKTADHRLTVSDGHGTLSVWAVAPDVLRIDFSEDGRYGQPTPIMDPGGLRQAKPQGKALGNSLSTSVFTAVGSKNAIAVTGTRGGPKFTIALQELEDGKLALDGIGGSGANLYGIHGIDLHTNLSPEEATTLRNQGGHVAARAQGNGGAPLAYSTRFGVLVDSVDGDFTYDRNNLIFLHGSRPDVEAYVVFGPPKRTIEVTTELTGHPPMPPKWTLGFMNSQWGSDQQEITSLVDEYRRRQIPLDSFILDFDFKAWGEDNYGEFRWNSTSGPGNVNPDAFPDGQSGQFAKQLSQKGIHLVGIMKPRILIQNVNGEMNVGAKEVTDHGWWMPNSKPYTDYFSHRQANNLDFSNPDLRAWYWKHAKGLFDAGIEGWWNDEADDNFPSLGFLQMQQSLAEGQWASSNKRVWSINRNFYLGAQRYAFGTWSGDIESGFKSMQTQRVRMLAMLDLNQPHWSMDSGGFNGHPDPENYARWIEFAATVPIMRVHGTYGEKRQPWVYGPVAESAAKAAIDLRYRLKPYLYSDERTAFETGVGVTRPMFWEFPDDIKVADIQDEWMFGDAFLVSPVVEQHQTSKSIYLPAGNWYDYWTDRQISGGQSITVKTDSINWRDMPMFVRGGSIVATTPVEQFAGEKPAEQLTLDVWPDQGRVAKFRVYDDDGETTAYTHGAYFSQNITVKLVGESCVIEFSRSHGKPTYKTYHLVVHHTDLQHAEFNDEPLGVLSGALNATMDVPAGKVGRIVLH